MKTHHLMTTTRQNRHSAHPYHGCGEVNESEIVVCQAVEAGGEAPEVLEFVEASFDTVPEFVERSIVGNGLFS